MNNLPLQFNQFKSSLDYGKQVRLMLPEYRINPKEMHKNDYPKRLAESIAQILSKTKVSTIILFRSLSVLEEVYEIMTEDKELLDYLILAQLISGKRNRNIKNFKSKKTSII